MPANGPRERKNSTMVDAETQMRHAGMTAETWLCQGITAIDAKFGDGYAEAHPKLLCGFMQAAGADEIAMSLRSIVEEGLGTERFYPESYSSTAQHECSIRGGMLDEPQ